MKNQQREDSSIDPIRTFVRIKPSSQRNSQPIAWAVDQFTVQTKNQDKFVFGIFRDTTHQILQHSFKGFNSCILAYGQTSSGKTYTMRGTQSDPGIIPQSLNQIFAKIKRQDYAARITVSYFQIYNENIYDLLSQKESTQIEIREDNRKNIFLNGLTETQVCSSDQALEIYSSGQEKRKFGVNNSNTESSRSHVIFRINLTVSDSFYEKTQAQINMVDLAGSEGMIKKGSNAFNKKQGQNINKSILALSKVIRSMSDKASNGGGYVNFRDSKLTRILQNSLCTNSKSTIICTINSNDQNFQETQNTLKFGQFASKIKIGNQRNRIIISSVQQQPNSQLLQNGNGCSAKKLFPSELIEFRDLKDKYQQLQKKNNQLFWQNNDYQGKRIQLENDLSRLEVKVDQLNTQNNRMKERCDELQEQYQSQRTMYESEFNRYKAEVDHMYNLYEEEKKRSRNLQRNEKALIDRHHLLTLQIKELTQQQKTNQMARSIMKQEAIKKLNTPIGKQPYNPFYVQPYNPNHSAVLSPSKLSDILELKTLIIELRMQNAEYIKANQELIEQMDQVKRVVDSYENEEIKHSHSKLNPSSLEMAEIRKLKNRINKLNKDLNICKEREKKLRQQLKHINNKKMHQMEQFHEFMNKKYNKDFVQQASVQIDETLLLNNLPETNHALEEISCVNCKNQRSNPKTQNNSLLHSRRSCQQNFEGQKSLSQEQLISKSQKNITSVKKNPKSNPNPQAWQKRRRNQPISNQLIMSLTPQNVNEEQNEISVAETEI